MHWLAVFHLSFRQGKTLQNVENIFRIFFKDYGRADLSNVAG